MNISEPFEINGSLRQGSRVQNYFCASEGVKEYVFLMHRQQFLMFSLQGRYNQIFQDQILHLNSEERDKILQVLERDAKLHTANKDQIR